MPLEYLSPFAVGGAAARADSFSGLDPRFVQSLADMYRAAPEDIRAALQITSAYRSPETQQQLWDQALTKYGSPEAARKWVAPPGRSNHNHGTAIDFRYGNDAARQWAHQNASNFGLAFPLSHEPWHVEPAWARGGARQPALNAINVAAPQAAPRRPQGIGFAPPPQRPGGIGGLMAGLGNFAGNVAAGVQSAVPPRQDIINAFINQGVRDFWSNPDMRPTVSQGGAYPVQTVSRQGTGISGLDFGSTSTAWGEDPVERNIRMANSDAIRAVTGSGAITQDAINQALSSGATLVRRI